MGLSSSATGQNSIAIGRQVNAQGYVSVALGNLTAASGDYSTALGNATIASDYATAMGNQATAGGNSSTAMGYLTTANGANSTAMGNQTTANGASSTAMGFGTIASGTFSTAMGEITTASGSNATAFGTTTTASGYNSTAFGLAATASGDYSIAIGSYVSTSNFTGAFVLGDNSTSTVMQSFVANGFRSRFAGGYRLLSNSAANLGVVLLPDGNSWGSISDVRLKENFLPTDGEKILKNISTMPLTTWVYKAQVDKLSRHYGPMAQDFFAAFGKDELGTIGCDTLINQQDFLGVNLIAIQALEKRTQKIEQLETENGELRAMLLELKKEVEKLKLKNK
jgi:hypothetical protein